MRVIVSLIFLSLFLYGQTINEQIHALEEATAEERVELMNSIKKQLVSMNAERRMQTIETLKEKLEHKNQSSEGASTLEQESISTEDMTHDEEASHIHNELHQHEYQHNHSGEK